MSPSTHRCLRSGALSVYDLCMTFTLVYVGLSIGIPILTFILAEAGYRIGGH